MSAQKVKPDTSLSLIGARNVNGLHIIHEYTYEFISNSIGVALEWSKAKSRQVALHFTQGHIARKTRQQATRTG